MRGAMVRRFSRVQGLALRIRLAKIATSSLGRMFMKSRSMVLSLASTIRPMR